jgi:hypothetical protein
VAPEHSDDTGDDFVEALVELETGASAGDLAEWCAEHGIDVTPMVAGALLTGPGGRFAEAFGERPKDRTHPQSLPVPPALKNAARSVTVLPVPVLGTDASSPE